MYQIAGVDPELDLEWHGGTLLYFSYEKFPSTFVCYCKCYRLGRTKGPVAPRIYPYLIGDSWKVRFGIIYAQTSVTHLQAIIVYHRKWPFRSSIRACLFLINNLIFDTFQTLQATILGICKTSYSHKYFEIVDARQIRRRIGMNITKTIDFESCKNIDHDIYNSVIQGKNRDQESVSNSFHLLFIAGDHFAIP